MIADQSAKTKAQDVLAQTPADMAQADTSTAPATLSAIGAAAALAACGGGDDGGGQSGGLFNFGAGSKVSAVVSNQDGVVTQARAARFLLRAQFSATMAEIDELSGWNTSTTPHTPRKYGHLSAWLDAQLSQPIPHLETGWNWLIDRGYSASVNIDGTAVSYKTKVFPAHRMMWYELLASKSPVRKRVAFALSEIFVISIYGITADWRSFSVANYWDILVGAVDGNFRQLIEKITLSTAMGDYLNTRGNTRRNPVKNTKPDENYARELLQLFTIGLHKLNLDGTPYLDANQNPQETFTQQTIENLAKIFTGYRYVGRNRHNRPAIRPTLLAHSRPIAVTNSNLHDATDVYLTPIADANYKIDGSWSAADRLKAALDVICNHPNVAPFFCKQLIQRLVTSNPAPAYVRRVVEVFNSTHGDLKEVVKAVLLDRATLVDPDNANLNRANFGKIREPILRFAQWARTFKPVSAEFKDPNSSGIPPSDYDPVLHNYRIPDYSDQKTGLGQSPMSSPSVFNFFTPDYKPLGSHLLMPEMQIVNEITVASYPNFIYECIYFGKTTDLPKGKGGGGLEKVPDYFDKLHLNDPWTDDDIVERVSLMLTADQLSSNTKTKIRTAINSLQSPEEKAKAAVFLTMTCPEYLVQK